MFKKNNASLNHQSQSKFFLLSCPHNQTMKQGIKIIGGLLVIFFIQLLANRWILPIQSPDENAHLARAYAISQGQWFLTTPAGNSSGVSIDSNLAHFMHGYLENIHIPGYRLSTEKKQSLNALQWSGESLFFPAPGTGYYNPLIYLPHATGLWLGKTFNYSIGQSYQLVRFFCFTLSLMTLFLAYRIYTPNALISFLLITPMALFQMLMPTIDGLSHSVLILILCWYMQLSQNIFISKKIKLHRIWLIGFVFCMLICFLVTTRFHSLPLILLILFLPSIFSLPQKFLGFLLAILIIGSWAILTSQFLVDLRISSSLSTSQILIFYLTDPQKWWFIFINTISAQTQWIIFAEGFIGILGWLHIYLSNWYYYFYSMLLLIFLILTLNHQTDFQLKRFLLFSVISVLSIFTIFNALLITWTPLASDTILGIQGRYFWIPLCCLVFSLGGSTSYRLATWSLLATCFILNFSIIMDAYIRYYH